MKVSLFTTVFAGLLVWVGLANADEPTAMDINSALYLPIFGPGSIWDERAEAVAERLGLQLQSNTDQSRIWARMRVSTGNGTLAEVRVISAPDGMTGSIELNFLNKGDFFNPRYVLREAIKKYGDTDKARQRAASPSGSFRRDLDKAYRNREEHWEETLTERLTNALGESSRGILKRSTRQRVRQWFWKDTALLLDVRGDEFVMVRIMTQAAAETGGKRENISDAEIKEIIAENVIREKNGDVWIKNIPMVDQGLKGYCAVASGERVLRYFGVPVDSHELAELAQTDKLGGTTWSGMKEALQRLASNNRRSFRNVTGSSSPSTVSRYIDRGIPLIWGMYVTADMEQIVRRRSRERKDMSPKRWEKRLRDERKTTGRIKPDHRGAHIRLIVGYNDETNEIAYSDSWGNAEIIWIEQREAKAISMGGKCLGAIFP